MNGNLELWFLILAIAFPRLALLIAWIFGGMPPHVGIPFWLCVLGSIFFARILVTIFIGINLGTSSPWFIAHALVAFINALGEYKIYEGTRIKNHLVS